MGPALQRLLSRPQSFELLRYLVGTPAPCTTSSNTIRKHTPDARKYSDGRTHGISTGLGWSVRSQNAELRPMQICYEIDPDANAIFHASENKPHEKQFGEWNENQWTRAQLEFESSLGSSSGDGKRMLDKDEYSNDMNLWTCLLLYRKRIYGDAGVQAFWSAIRDRCVVLPTASWGRRTGQADLCWPTFLELGFRDNAVLEQVVEYADQLWKSHQKRWVGLYVHIVQHFLLQGRSLEAKSWHKRLLCLHSPSQRDFAEMCRQVTELNGDMKTLNQIYQDLPYRNVYSKIVPRLCAKERFREALQWHRLFVKRGDLPATSKLVEPLIRYLVIYEPTIASSVTKSLADAGVSFGHSLSHELKRNTMISREIMNLIHGKTFGIQEKTYNDALGARLFATRWIPLDMAINIVHALGVEEVGPLSLQAICLREPDAMFIVTRISQLKDLGISTGTSLYARAIAHFARTSKHELLKSLLHSDQHPEELAKIELQEGLLTAFARNQDWLGYQRTLEILSLASTNPPVENQNLVLRSLLRAGDRPAISRQLRRMQFEQVPVTAKSMRYLLHHTLRARNLGRRPIATSGSEPDDLHECIKALSSLMSTGSYVPITLWKEIVRRLGKLGRLVELRKLCLSLARWYSISSPYNRKPFRVPVEVPVHHPLHPLKMLFSVSCQKAIIDWGFIHTLNRQPHYHSMKSKAMHLHRGRLPYVSGGILLLKRLHELGVHIDGPSVRKAILNRLVTYYGTSKISNKKYNRAARFRLRGLLPQIAQQIDEALGGDYFNSVNLEGLVKQLAVRKVQTLQRRRLNKTTRTKNLVE